MISYSPGGINGNQSYSRIEGKALDKRWSGYSISNCTQSSQRKKGMRGKKRCPGSIKTFSSPTNSSYLGLLRAGVRGKSEHQTGMIQLIQSGLDILINESDQKAQRPVRLAIKG